jgi:RNA polymerase sigma-70 factor, ECF subfamily
MRPGMSVRGGESAVEDGVAHELVARIQAGEDQAFAELYDLYFDRVYAYLRVVLKDEHEAEDVSQQVFIKVLEALPRYERRRQPFRAWLFVIARNEGIGHLRRNGRIQPEESDSIDRRRAEQLGDEAELPVLSWVSDQDLMMFIDRLPLAQRQVLGLRYLLDLSNQEAAEVMGRSADQVKVLNYRALSFLRDRLEAVGRRSEQRGRVRLTRRFRQVEVLRHRRFALR